MLGATLVQRYLLSRGGGARSTRRRSTSSPGELLALPMSYFNTRRTGDIERRLAGMRQVRELRRPERRDRRSPRSTQLVAAVALMFVYSWTLALVFLATVPLYALLMRFSSQPAAADLRQPRGGVRPLPLAPDRRDQGHRDGQGAGRRGRAAAADARRSSTSLADRLFRADFTIMVYDGRDPARSRSLSLALFLWVGALQVIDGTLTIGELVAFNALVALANGAGRDRCSRSGTSSSSRACCSTG